MNVRRVIPKDAIPSVDDPAFGSTYDGAPDDPLVVVETASVVRGYPVRYLQFHEIVNDDLSDDASEGGPIAVTWCPLCGSAVVYSRRRRDRTLTFGVSGKLADDALVMYDRETESEWKQSTGRCLGGEFEGESLDVRPSTVVSWDAFRETYSEGIVLQPPGGESEAASDDDSPAPIDYDAAPYEAYRSREGFGLAAHRGTGTERTWARDDPSPKAVVLGIEAGAEAMGFPLPTVRAAGGIVQATVGDRDVVVFATEADGIHGYENPGLTFDRDGAAIVADGTEWGPINGVAADGRRLEQVPTRRLFAFAWQDDHGPDSFYPQS